MRISTKDKLMQFIPEKVVIIVMVLAILKSAFFSYLLIGYATKKDILLDAMFILVVFYFFQIFFKEKKYFILYFTYILYSILVYANILNYREYTDFLTVAMVKELFMASKVEQSITSLIKLYDILFFLDLIILYPYIRNRNKKKVKSVTSTNVIILAFIVIIINGSIVLANYRSPDKNGGVEVNKIHLYESVGLIDMSIDDSYNYLKNNLFPAKPTKSILDSISKQMRVSKVSNSKYKDKNLIIIQVESLQGFVINKKYNGKEITPNLNKFLNESAYFSNCYYQVGIGHTSDAELLTNTSLYPMEGVSAYVSKPSNDYNAISSVMNKIGYKSMAFHGNYADFWNRAEIYRKYRISKFYSLSNMKRKDLIGLGLSDSSLFSQTFKILNECKRPFYSLIVTLTSHDPFLCTNNFCRPSSYLTKYYNAINYTDRSIGMFLDKLKKSGILDKSIIVIYGDHNAIPYGNKGSLSDALGENFDLSYKWQKYQKVPLVIRFPNGENKGIYTKSVGQIDVFPTILDLYGIKNERTFGDNIFDKGDDFVVLRDGSYILGNTYYNNDEKATYNILNGTRLDNNNNLIDKANKQLKASDDIFKYNYFKYDKKN